MKLFQDFFRWTKVFYFSAILVKDDVISYTVGGDSDYSMKQLGARRIPTPTGWNISLILSPPPRTSSGLQGNYWRSFLPHGRLFKPKAKLNRLGLIFL